MTPRIRHDTGTPEWLVLHVRLTITAGYFGIFPETELIVWLRSVLGDSGKALVVQPVEPYDRGEGAARHYTAVESIVDANVVAELVRLLDAIGFPGRPLHIDNTADPEMVRWERVTFEVSKDGKAASVQFTVGPGGMAGADAVELRQVLHVLWKSARIDSPWSDSLGLRQ
jgi:hypothetical protein